MKAILFLLLPVISFSQLNELDVAFLSHPDGVNVPKLEKFELGVRLPNDIQRRIDNFVKEREVSESEKLNPFLEWELDVEAVFTHEASRTVKTVDAFYYREYERSPKLNSWTDIGTIHSMRIRFSPPLTGTWTCTVSTKVKGKLRPDMKTITFEVTFSPNPGYISVHGNRKNLQLNNEIIYPVGVNFAAPIKNVVNYHTGVPQNPTGGYPPDETHKVTKLSEWLTYHNDVATFHDGGGQFIRTIQNGWATLLEFEKKGNYYDRQPYAWEQDRLLEYCEKNGIYICFNLMQQEPFMRYGNYDMFDWDWSHYRRDGSYDENDPYPAYCYSDGQNKEPYEALTNADDMRYHEQRTRYYLSRYGYSTSIYAFELLSEPYHIDQVFLQKEPFFTDTPLGDSVRAALRSYQESLSTYIKKERGHTEHLLAVNVLMDVFIDEKFVDRSMYHPDIDLVTMNPYSGVPDKMIISKAGENNVVLPNENTLYRTVYSIRERIDKPVLMAEGGSEDGKDGCSNYAQQNVDMETFGMCGFAGFHSWVGAFPNQEEYLLYILRSAGFMSSPTIETVLNGNWVQGRQAEKHYASDIKKSKETQYYVSEDRSAAFGYVKNRTYNYHTARTSESCYNGSFAAPFDTLTDITWDEGRKELYVEGLKRGAAYTVEWFDPKTGAKLLTELQRTGRSKFLLRFPELKVTDLETARPVLWFVITEAEE